MSDGGSEITEKGFVWSTEENPSLENESDSFACVSGDVFEYELKDLEQNTVYFVKAFARNDEGLSYGEQLSFTTKYNLVSPTEPDGYINGYAYADLGLPSGLKWACHNIGAESPVDCGDYFAWGSIVPFAECTTMDMEMTDFSGDAQYDAARANWG